MRYIPVIILLLVLAAAHLPAAVGERPNVVVILIDDFGFECVSANGGASYRTPNLDRLAADGVRFTNCYAQPICTPSRVKLLTGRYNHRNYQGFGFLDLKERTFANELRDAGYATAIFGKWQLNGENKRQRELSPSGRERPGHFGFDTFALWQLTKTRTQGERYDDPLLEGPQGFLPDMDNRYGPDVFTDQACAFIDANRDKPFLLYYPMVLTHCPFWPTPDSKEWADPKQRRPGHSYKGDPQYFADQVAYMDKMVGRVVDHLQAQGLLENTLIMVVGDNGTDTPIVSKMTDGRVIAGAKGMTTNGGTHVPFIVSWPAQMKPSQVIDNPVDLADFFPTVLEAAQVPLPTDRIIDGQSLLPMATGQDLGEHRDWIFSHYWGENGRVKEGTIEFVRDRRFKLYNDGRLYDVQADPLEKSPIANPQAAAAQAQQRLEQAFALVHARNGEEKAAP